ncbi:unnamed protein product [Caretta caretta]
MGRGWRGCAAVAGGCCRLPVRCPTLRSVPAAPGRPWLLRQPPVATRATVTMTLSLSVKGTGAGSVLWAQPQPRRLRAGRGASALLSAAQAPSGAAALAAPAAAARLLHACPAPRGKDPAGRSRHST